MRVEIISPPCRHRKTGIGRTPPEGRVDGRVFNPGTGERHALNDLQ
jgi:hypothetical protein